MLMMYITNVVQNRQKIAIGSQTWKSTCSFGMELGSLSSNKLNFIPFLVIDSIKTLAKFVHNNGVRDGGSHLLLSKLGRILVVF